MPPGIAFPRPSPPSGATVPARRLRRQCKPVASDMDDLSPQPNVLTAGGRTSFSALFWPALVTTAVGTGLGAGLLMRLLRFVQHLAYSYQSGTFLDAVSTVSPARRVVVMVGAGALAGIAALLLKKRGGHHAGELTVALWFHAGRLSPVTVLARSILSIVLVGLGASLGREAAPKQVGALLGSMTGLRARLTPSERRLLVACGAGAGMGAVYNVPLGGALFGLEVLLGTLSLPLAVPALLASGVATASSWLLLPAGATYHAPSYAPSSGLIAWSLLAGPVTGLASVAYTRLICWADTSKPGGAWAIATPVAAFAAVGALAIADPGILGNGKDVVQLAFLDRLALPGLCALVLLKPVATALCLGSGAPGGLFTPTLMYGSLVGALLGRAANTVWPGLPVGACALIGAGAILAATTLGPISAIVLLLELVHPAAALLLPVLLAVGGAVLTARALEPRSIYSGRIHAARRVAMNGETSAGDLPASAGVVEVLARLLARGDDARIVVTDDLGVEVGTISAGGHQGGDAARVLDTTSAIVTASDLARVNAPTRAG